MGRSSISDRHAFWGNPNAKANANANAKAICIVYAREPHGHGPPVISTTPPSSSSSSEQIIPSSGGKGGLWSFGGSESGDERPRRVFCSFLHYQKKGDRRTSRRAFPKASSFLSLVFSPVLFLFILFSFLFFSIISPLLALLIFSPHFPLFSFFFLEKDVA